MKQQIKLFLLPKRVNGAKRNLSTKNKPWFGSQCKSARRSYHRARKQFDLNKTPQNRQYLSTSSKVYKRTMNRYINKFKYDREHKLRSMQSKNPKQYWKFLNSIQSKSNAKCPTIEEFYDYFEQLNAPGNSQSVPIDPLENMTFDEDDDILSAKITEQEIMKCISLLNNGKSPGNDNILNEYIKSTKH